MSGLNKQDIFPAHLRSLAESSGEDPESDPRWAHNGLDLVGYWPSDKGSARVDNDDRKLHNGTCLSNTSTATVSSEH